MLGNTAVQDAPAVVANDEKTVEQPKCDGWHGEEIHGRDGLTVILQKCQPPFRGVRVAWGPLHPARYGSFGDIESQFEQFAVNTRRTPRWIFGYHAKDQLASFFIDSLSAGSCGPLRQELPIQPESCTMPANNSTARIRVGKDVNVASGELQQVLQR